MTEARVGGKSFQVSGSQVSGTDKWVHHKLVPGYYIEKNDIKLGKISSAVAKRCAGGGGQPFPHKLQDPM